MTKPTFATTPNGTRIAVLSHEGSGPVVLLIHGIGSSSGDFNPVIEKMREFSSPVCIDLRGHGDSDKPESGYHYSNYVDDLNAVLAALDLNNPIVLGHSLGGIITLMWAAQNPETAKAIIIEDSPLRSGEDFREAFEGWLQLNDLPQATAKSWYADRNPHWPEDVLEQRSFDMVNTSHAAIVELQSASLSGEGLDTVHGLDKITAPVLFLQGDPTAGSMVHRDDLAALENTIPNMQIETFPEAGHTIHRAQPEAWLRSVRAFLESL